MFNVMLVFPDGNVVLCVAFPHLHLLLPEPCRSELHYLSQESASPVPNANILTVLHKLSHLQHKRIGIS